jgi:hypothetical protein
LELRFQVVDLHQKDDDKYERSKSSQDVDAWDDRARRADAIRQADVSLANALVRRTARGKSTLLALPLLLLITLLPVSTAVHSIQDLMDGPEVQSSSGKVYLRHSGRVLEGAK